MLCPLCQEGFPQDIVIQGFIMGLYDDDYGDDAEHEEEDDVTCPSVSFVVALTILQSSSIN